MVRRESEPRSCGKHSLAFHIVNSLYIVTTTVELSHACSCAMKCKFKSYANKFEIPCKSFVFLLLVSQIIGRTMKLGL